MFHYCLQGSCHMFCKPWKAFGKPNHSPTTEKTPPFAELLFAARGQRYIFANEIKKNLLTKNH